MLHSLAHNDKFVNAILAVSHACENNWVKQFLTHVRSSNFLPFSFASRAMSMAAIHTAVFTESIYSFPWTKSSLNYSKQVKLILIISGTTSRYLAEIIMVSWFAGLLELKPILPSVYKDPELEVSLEVGCSEFCIGTETQPVASVTQSKEQSRNWRYGTWLPVLLYVVTHIINYILKRGASDSEGRSILHWRVNTP